MSEVKVNKISPRTNCGTVTVGDSGDSVSVSAGVPVTVNGDLKSSALKAPDGGVIVSQCGTANTIGASGDTVTVAGNDLRSDAYKAADGGSIISQSGTTITIGASGDTVSLASGASQSGFGRSGSVDWQTTAKTSNFTAADGEGYFINTTSGAITMTLPAGSAGAIVSAQDYNNTFDSNDFIVQAAGSDKINGGSGGGKITLNTEGEGITLVYVDGTVGWRSIEQSVFTDQSAVAQFVTATGGTITTSGDFKIHTFTGPGTFCVSCAGNACGSSTVSYMVVAGGGGGGPGNVGGGGGAGGFREGKTPCTPYTASPLVAPAGLPVSVQGYPITVGGGGTGSYPSNNGSNSIFSSITSAGGGKGGAGQQGGSSGGSGGGGGELSGSGGSGNTPPVSPPQGQSGGPTGTTKGGGGGGAGQVGQPGPGTGNGGNGVTTEINASPVARAGGGGGGAYSVQHGSGGSGGQGGGGAGAPNQPTPGTPGTANTGGGAGGTGYTSGAGSAGSGGSGIVIIRYRFQ